MSDIVKSLVNLFFKKKAEKLPGNNQTIKNTVHQYYDDKLSNINKAQDSSINDEPLTDLDRLLQNKPTNIETFLRANTPMIYAFITEHVPDMIKVGFTDQGVETRIKQWQKFYPDVKEALGYWTATEFYNAKEAVYFKDFAVHKRINKRGFAQIDINREANTIRELAINKDMHDMHVSQEFFHKYSNLDSDEKAELSTQILEDIILELKKDIRNNENLTDISLYKLLGDDGTNKVDKVWKAPADFKPTGLQETAIENGVNAIKEGKTDLLLAAVMRMGKSFCSLSIAKQSGAKLVLVTSAKADVRDSWRNEVNHIDFINDFVFLEFYGDKINETAKGDEGRLVTKEGVVVVSQLSEYIKKLLKEGKTVVVFATLQDLSGRTSEIKLKHKFLYDPELPVDLMVIDETHYGSHSNKYGEATGLRKAKEYINQTETEKEDKALALKELKELEATSEFINKEINAKVRLQCSGTPYYILCSEEFAPYVEGKEIISKVSFSDMIHARDEWAADHGDAEQQDSPYFGIPNIIKFGMQISDVCRKNLGEFGISTTMEELFRMDKNHEKFLHEKSLITMMQSIFGNGKGISGLLNVDKALSGDLFKHCIMVVPHIYTCPALEKLLLDEKIINPKDREIIVLTESRTKRSEGGYGVSKKAINSDTLNEELNNLEKEGKKSLCITVKRMLTGVSVPLWDCMLYMRDTNSPQEYDQAIFRLCTRNVKKAVSTDGEEIKINKKPNVYLIDFNVDRMFELAIQSATAQCAAKGQSRPEDIQKAIEEQTEYMPIYAETHTFDNSKTLEGMHEINSKDLLKIYANYNKNKDIESNIADSIGNGDFNNFLNNPNNINIVRRFEQTYAVGFNDKLKDEINIGGSDYIDMSGYENEAPIADKDFDFNGSPSSDKDLKKEIKERFIGMLKNILYFNICLDNPCKDIEELVERINNDEKLERDARLFKLDSENLKELYEGLSVLEKAKINVLLLQLNTLLNDESIDPIERVQNAVAKLGRITEADGKEYFVTKPELARKMVEKIPDSEWKKADNILTVNSKMGEWLIEIYKKFGKEVANRVKIVPAGEKTKMFIKKVLNILGLNEYNILDIEDKNRNGTYDVRDFLDLENEKLIELCNMPKGSHFNFVIQNPPYSTSSDNLHLKFVDKCLNISDKQVVIMPITFITKHNIKSQDIYKDSWNNKIVSIEEVDSKLFTDTHMPNVGIYYLDNNRKTDTINIKLFNKDEENIQSLHDISNFTEYENEILNCFNNKSMVTVKNLGYFLPLKHLLDKGITKQEDIYNEKLKNALQCVKNLPDNKVFLICNSVNGGMNCKFFTTKNGQIINGKEDLVKYIMNINDLSNGYNSIILNSVKAAKNCKIALDHPLMRLLLFRSQQDQRMTGPKCYKYVPNINWEDDRVKTDEGLLAVCGCPKDKCKEYANYCKKVIEEVDNNE